MIQRHRPELTVGCGDVLLNGTQGNVGQELRAGTAQGTGDVAVNGLGRNIRARGDADYGIVRRVLNDVKGHVAEVTLVTNTVAAAQTGGAVAEDIPGEADARGKVVLVLYPKSPDGPLVGDLHAAAAYLVVDGGTRPQIEVGIQSGIGVVRHPVVLPGQAQVQGQARGHLPRILNVERAIVVAVVTGKRRFGRRQVQRAARVDVITAIFVLNARELTLRVERALELVDVTGDEVRKSVGEVASQNLYRVKIRAEYAVVADLDIGATKFKLVFALGPGDVLVELIEVLWTAKGKGICRRVLHVPRENILETGPGQSGNRAGTEQARRHRSGAQRLIRTVDAVVVDLARTHQIRGEHVGEVEVHILVVVGLTGVIPDIRAVVNDAGEIVLTVESVAAVNRGLVGPVVVNTLHRAVSILRISATGIRGGIVGYCLCKWRAGGQAGNVASALSRWARLAPGNLGNDLQVGDSCAKFVEEGCRVRRHHRVGEERRIGNFPVHGPVAAHPGPLRT